MERGKFNPKLTSLNTMFRDEEKNNDNLHRINTEINMEMDQTCSKNEGQ